MDAGDSIPSNRNIWVMITHGMLAILNTAQHNRDGGDSLNSIRKRDVGDSNKTWKQMIVNIATQTWMRAILYLASETWI